MFNFLTAYLLTTPALVDTASLGEITKTLTANVAVILPWGLGLLAIFIGIRQIPNLIKMFSRG